VGRDATARAREPRARHAGAGERVTPLPDATPAPPPPAPSEGGGLPTDDALHAPIPRRAGTLVVPTGGASGTVELDVLVDPLGRVVDVRWADGVRDTALVRAAERCAETMTFYPALLRGAPVAVWCRQRFEFSPR
jgi:TonB family protein